MRGKLKTIPKNFKLKGKKVLLRVDFNMPLEKFGNKYRVMDTARLEYAIPTIVRLSKAGARVILLTHIGEPDGKIITALRVKPIIEKLKHLLPKEVPQPRSIYHWRFKQLRSLVNELEDGEIFCLENVRFHKGEEPNDRTFAKELSTLADLYVNEAFSVSHRTHASLVGICNYLPHYAGWRFAEEVAALDRVSVRPRRPFVLVLGGAKAHDKIALMIKLVPRVTVILLAGVVANTLLKMKGIGIGRSRFDEHPAVASLEELMKKFQAFPGFKEKINLLELPLDAIVANGPDGPARVVDFSAGENLKPTESIYDIGPKTMRHFAMFLRKARTIVWNGPMGMIEQRRFRHGSLVVAEMIAARSKGKAFGVVGGGESIAVLNETGMAKHVDYISTGGGAMLEYLSGQELSGLKPLLINPAGKVRGKSKEKTS